MKGEIKSELAEIYRDLGFRALNTAWGKCEIILGLAAAGIGILVMMFAVDSQYLDFEEWTLATAGILLFMLGGYLTLAGHRTHIYQVNNMLTAYLNLQSKNNSTKVDRQ